ncbi:MAG TPA: ricin-type beta-trefoil lectin domain protein [Streptosporangiaceae bacterium]
MRARFLSGMAACAAAALVAGLASAPASAASHAKAGPRAAWVTPAAPRLPALVSPNAVSWTPNVFAGSPACNPQWFGSGTCAPSTVYSMAVVNGEVVVAGAFTQACVPGPVNNCTAGTMVTRNDIFAYQLGTGAIDPGFTPVLDRGPVYSVVAGPDNTVYAGGAFTTVNGASHPGVVQLSVGGGADGQVVPGFTGSVSGYARSVAYNGNALYVGGNFSKADGTPASGITRLNAATGALDTSFQFTLGDKIAGTALGLNTLTLSPDGNHLAIGGSFLQVNGQSRPRVAMINTGGGLGAAATLANWSSPLLANDCSLEHDYVNDIDFSPDSSFFVVVTTGFKSAGGASICDAAARFQTAATGTGVQPVWINYNGGDTFHSVAIAGSVVYVGGHNRWVNNECGNNVVCEANAVLVNGVAALDANTGLALPWWRPGTLRGVGVQDLTPIPPGTPSDTAGGLLLGTDVSTIGGAFHGENALFPLTTATAPTPGGPIPSGMFSLGRIGGLDETNQGKPAMCIDDAVDSSKEGTKVQFWTCLNDASQNWAIQPNGTVQVNGQCLAVAGSAKVPANGAKIQIWACNGASNQQWHQGAGNTLVNGADGKCLDDPSASTTKGTQLQLWTCNGGGQQVWPLPAAQAPPPPPARGMLFSGELQADTQVPCLQDPNGSTTSGTAVQMWTCIEYPAEQWTLASNGTVQIDGLCLDTTGGGTVNGTQVVLDTCTGGASQIWTAGSKYALVNKAAGKCLDDTNSNTANGATIQIWACNGGLNQEWRLPTI